MDSNEATATQNTGKIQAIGQTFAAQLTWLVAKALVTTFVTGSIGMVAMYIKDIRDDLKTQGQHIEQQDIRFAAQDRRLDEQDKSLTLNDQKIESMQKVSDATVLTLRQVGDQLTLDRRDIDELKMQQRRR